MAASTAGSGVVDDIWDSLFKTKMMSRGDLCERNRLTMGEAATYKRGSCPRLRPCPSTSCTSTGQHTEPASGDYFESDNPYLGTPWALIPRGTAEDVDRAVRAAHRAFTTGEWPRMTPTRRGMLLRRLGELVTEHAARLAEIDVRDNGKLYAEMIAHTSYMAQWYHYYGGLADKIEGAVVPADKPDIFNYTRWEPLGVVAAIVPWNSPLLLTTWKMAPALAAGNTIVIKPSEYTSASALELMSLVEEAGFPPGVVNVVTGFGHEVGAPLVEHPLVAKVAFTGSDATGQRVYEAAARGLKRVSMELGGKSPNIVFDDANLDHAVKGVIAGIFAATGQTCIAGSRLLVQRSIHDQFLESLLAFAKTARMGEPDAARTRRSVPSRTSRSWPRCSTTSRSPRPRAPPPSSAAAAPHGPSAATAGSWSRPSSPASTTGCGSRRKRCSDRCCR